MQWVCRFTKQSTLKPFLTSGGSSEVSPGVGVTTDAQFNQFVKDNIGVAYHPLGTAAIGDQSKGGVVDVNLKVYGTANVFVVDGSIIPMQPSSHPSSIIYGIGEKAAVYLNSCPTSLDY
ncbi:GMC oxidoreductase-domain-containing protein [Mycena rosella]|uniref:GMC oxidoreductase-domain-containing protein n=1 Tax=Mycena rosella TaxID=1033263 RepID=A0AAD7M7W9_MYCRO|nr:GMC oxidoreductase-domain-containing protein [Mycena rosella]